MTNTHIFLICYTISKPYFSFLILFSGVKFEFIITFCQIKFDSFRMANIDSSTGYLYYLLRMTHVSASKIWCILTARKDRQKHYERGVLIVCIEWVFFGVSQVLNVLVPIFIKMLICMYILYGRLPVDTYKKSIALFH